MEGVETEMEGLTCEKKLGSSLLFLLAKSEDPPESLALVSSVFGGNNEE